MEKPEEADLSEAWKDFRSLVDLLVVRLNKKLFETLALCIHTLACMCLQDQSLPLIPAPGLKAPSRAAYEAVSNVNLEMAKIA